jgi:pyridoxal/pyridoxine/pyridoxamine kinase
MHLVFHWSHVLALCLSIYRFAGDMLSALLLAWLHRHPDNLQLAVGKAVAGVQLVILKTLEAAGASAQSAERSSQVARGSLAIKAES